MKFVIKKEPFASESQEHTDFYAEVEGKRLPGSRVKVFRHLSPIDFKWSKWKILWSGCEEGTYEEKLPFVAVINEAMAFLKEKMEIFDNKELKGKEEENV